MNIPKFSREGSLRNGSTLPDEATSEHQAAEERSLRINRAAEALSRGVDHDSNFRFLYDSYCKPLQRFFARQGFAPEECLDLTQETFVGILKGMKAYRHQGRFQSWLYQLAKNTYLKRWRTAAAVKRSGHEVSQEEVGEAVAAVSLPAGQLETAIDNERRQLMLQAVLDLPKQMRQCMTLHLYQGLGNPEIATIMKISLNTVKAHIFQGRKKLLAKLSEISLGDHESKGGK